MTKERLISLDAFRGFTIASMVLVNNPGDWGTSTASSATRSGTAGRLPTGLFRFSFHCRRGDDIFVGAPAGSSA